MTVSLERAEKALRYLADTDEEIAEAKAQVARAEYLVKAKEAHAYLSCEGTVKDRESQARTSPEYRQAYEAATKALGVYEHIRAKRETERLVWETWRSLESSRRAGQ